MAFLLKQIFGFLKLLNSDKGSNQIAAGIAVGFVLGMTPAFSLQTLLMIACLFLFRIQIGAATVFAVFFSPFAYLLDPMFHAAGVWVLERPALQATFEWMYQAPVIPFTRFNNTVVMGSGFVAITMLPFVFMGARWAAFNYREKFVSRFEGTRAWKAFKASSFFQWYAKYEQLTGV